LHQLTDTAVFKRRLKSELFQQAYWSFSVLAHNWAMYVIPYICASLRETADILAISVPYKRFWI